MSESKTSSTRRDRRVSHSIDDDDEHGPREKEENNDSKKVDRVIDSGDEKSSSRRRAPSADAKDVLSGGYEQVYTILKVGGSRNSFKSRGHSAGPNENLDEDGVHSLSIMKFNEELLNPKHPYLTSHYLCRIYIG